MAGAPDPQAPAPPLLSPSRSQPHPLPPTPPARGEEVSLESLEQCSRGQELESPWKRSWHLQTVRGIGLLPCSQLEKLLLGKCVPSFPGQQGAESQPERARQVAQAVTEVPLRMAQTFRGASPGSVCPTVPRIPGSRPCPCRDTVITASQRRESRPDPRGQIISAQMVRTRQE